MRKIAVAIIALSCMTQAATAQERPFCRETAELTKILSQKYRETPIAFGLQSNGNLLQVYSSEETWTVVSATPQGISCIVAAGKHWQTRSAPNTDPMA